MAAAGSATVAVNLKTLSHHASARVLKSRRSESVEGRINKIVSKH